MPQITSIRSAPLRNRDMSNFIVICEQLPEKSGERSASNNLFLNWSLRIRQEMYRALPSFSFIQVRCNGFGEPFISFRARIYSERPQELTPVHMRILEEILQSNPYPQETTE